MPAVTTNGARDLGAHLRHWRAVRGRSQLDLASDAGTTPRYVSFVETGRSQPSRQMVLRLARALDIPLRERNDLLQAAGYAAVYPLEPLSSPQLATVDRALSSMLDQHLPFPAVVMNRAWDLQRTNEGAVHLFGRLLHPDPLPERVNVLRAIIEPGPVRNSVANWRTLAPALLERTRREAVGGVLDARTAGIVAELGARPDVRDAVASADTATVGPVIDVCFDVDGTRLSFLSVVSTIGSPIDVTAQELRVESFFPADDATREAWPSLMRDRLPGA